MLICDLLARAGKLVARYIQKSSVFILAMCLASTSLAADPLDEIIESRNELEAAREVFRHPKETLRFFDVRPGMTVVETLPGRGWYSKFLVPYLGPSGHFIAANYTLDISAKIFGVLSDNCLLYTSDAADE